MREVGGGEGEGGGVEATRSLPLVARFGRVLCWICRIECSVWLKRSSMFFTLFFFSLVESAAWSCASFSMKWNPAYPIYRSYASVRLCKSARAAFLFLVVCGCSAAVQLSADTGGERGKDNQVSSS